MNIKATQAYYCLSIVCVIVSFFSQGTDELFFWNFALYASIMGKLNDKD